jgi:hypothetical protein
MDFYLVAIEEKLSVAGSLVVNFRCLNSLTNSSTIQIRDLNQYWLAKLHVYPVL